MDSRVDFGISTSGSLTPRSPRPRPAAAPARQDRQQELFVAYRYYAVFIDSGASMLHAKATHRDHAIVEQIIAEL